MKHANLDIREFIKNRMLNRFDFIAGKSLSTGLPCPMQVNSLDSCIDSHLEGRSSISELGTYTINWHGLTKFGVIDIDGGDHHKYPVKFPNKVALLLMSSAEKKGIKAEIVKSRSGSGFHIWFFFSDFVQAHAIRKFIINLCKFEVELNCGGFADIASNRGWECFPKQDSISQNAFGNLIWLPWFNVENSDSRSFFDPVTNRIKVPGELAINSFNLLDPWILDKKNQPLKIAQSSKITYSGHLEDLFEISKKCSALNELLVRAKNPPIAKNGLDNRSRLRLAQIAKRVGISTDQIISLFSNQPNFNERICRSNINSLSNTMPPPSCKKIAADLGLCDGRCENITSIRSGSPIALLNKNLKGGR
jgi:hypothetical protein